MVHHVQCTGYNCYLDKPKYHNNPLPTFRFPVKTHHETTSSTTIAATDAVKTFMTDTVQAITEEAVLTSNITTAEIIPTTAESITSTVQQMADVFNTSLTDIIDLTTNNTSINEQNTSNTNFIVGVMEGVSNSSITDTVDNGTMVINNDLSSTSGNNEEITSAISDIIIETTESTISFVRSTTEKVINFVTSNTIENNKFDGHFNHHSAEHDSHKSIYVILGIILAILILIVVIIIVIYVRYRKSNSHKLHNHQYYEITTKKENNPTSSEDDQSKNCVNDIYVQYAC